MSGISCTLLGSLLALIQNCVFVLWHSASELDARIASSLTDDVDFRGDGDGDGDEGEELEEDGGAQISQLIHPLLHTRQSIATIPLKANFCLPRGMASSFLLKLMLMKIDLVTHVTVPRADTDPNQVLLVDLLDVFVTK